MNVSVKGCLSLCVGPATGWRPVQGFPLRTYYYVDKKMNWNDAQQYCREKYTDLATFESMDDINSIKPNFSYSWAWIGLYDDPKSWKTTMGNDTNSWRWATTNKTSTYYNWDSTSPDNLYGRESCVVMGTGGRWFDRNCDSSKSYDGICSFVQEGTG
uniref:C-type lectin domain-containing protein n=1 Tax=Amphilophus citrinellus TaxID=61819 RepID=A0A3Q0QY80_AMPCI